jgi:hypothetical protein
VHAPFPMLDFTLNVHWATHMCRLAISAKAPIARAPALNRSAAVQIRCQAAASGASGSGDQVCRCKLCSCSPRLVKMSNTAAQGAAKC